MYNGKIVQLQWCQLSSNMSLRRTMPLNKPLTILFLVFVLFYCLCIPPEVQAADLMAMETPEVKVIYPSFLRGAAREVLSMYPQVKREVEAFFQWQLMQSPTIVLAIPGDRDAVRSKGDLVVGYAVPQRHLVVIFYTKTKASPRDVEVVLKHELCHLIVHEHIDQELLPRWLDEGLCQVVSGVAGEIGVQEEKSLLELFRRSGGVISLNSLTHRFPTEANRLLLAYAESKAFVTYLIDQFGKETVLSVLDKMKRGCSIAAAMRNTTGHSLRDVEKTWHRSVKARDTWLARLSYYLYEILFGLGALICAYAFVRQMRARRAYKDAASRNDEDTS